MICWRKKPTSTYRTVYVHQLTQLEPRDHPVEKFCSNAIISSRYTWYNFFPKNLFEQFHNIANVFFALVTILYMYAEASTSVWANLGPLFAIIFITMCKDGVEDILRHRRDRKINRDSFFVLRIDPVEKRIHWIPKAAEKIVVGDIVICESNRTFPCDLVVLASSDPTSQLSVTTMNLDGESNLKKYFAVPKTQVTYFKYSMDQLDANSSYRDLSKVVQDLYLSIHCQLPDPDLTKFEGRLSTRTDSDLPLKFENLVLRGAKLCNTKFVLGIAVYTGKDTKLSLNGKRSKRKYSSRESRSNVILLGFILAMVILAVIFAIVFTMITKNTRHSRWFIPVVEQTPWQFVQNTFRFIFFLNYLIPISIIITIDFQQLLIASLISEDMKMYSPTEDLSAKANNSQLADDLGQVEFLFSDKTGTLTQNLMNLRLCALLEQQKVYRFEPTTVNVTDECSMSSSDDGSPGGTRLSRAKPIRHNPDESVAFRNYLITSALCHTVDLAMDEEEVGAEGQDLKYHYKASSPDEKALVEAAASNGIVFAGVQPAKDETTAKIYLIEDCTTPETVAHYRVDAILPFDSVRKRMTVMVRHPDGTCHVHSKGAETSILSTEAISPSSSVLQSRAMEYVTEFALEGLRTLVFASRQIPEEEYNSMIAELDVATGLVGATRDRAMKDAYARIESDLTPVYVTGVNDELQPGVKRCLQQLREAGIQVWVLTGDKEETAIAVSQAAGHFSRPMSLIRLTKCTDFEQAACALFQQLDGLQADVEDRKEAKIDIRNSAITVRSEEIDNTVYRATEVELEKRGGRYDKISLQEHLRRFRNRLMAFTKRDESKSRIHRRKRRKHPGRAGESIGLVVDGRTLCFLLEPSLREAFLDLCMNVTTVLCCRLTPLQKASVVQLVQVGLTYGGQSSPVTVAVGDGGNDVAMLLQANIGVGIYGKEGLEAARAGDYSLPGFRHLARLFFLHGHWAHHRLTYTMNLFYYKCTALVTTQILFNFYNGFSQMVSYNTLIFALYNLTMTSLTCLFYGMYERHLTEKDLVERPYLYRKITSQANLSAWYICLWILDGIWLGVVSFTLTYLSLAGTAFYSPAILYDQGLSAHAIYDHTAVGTATFIVLWISVNIRIAIWSRDMNIMILIGFLVTALNIALLYANDKILFVSMALSPGFWLTFVLTVTVASLPGLIWRLISDAYWSVQIFLSTIPRCRLKKYYQRDIRLWLWAFCHGRRGDSDFQSLRASLNAHPS